MDSMKEIKDLVATLGLINTRESLQQLIHAAEQENLSYTAFLRKIFKDEIKYRQNKAQAKRIKEAGFPYPKSLKDFDLDFCQSITPKQLNQLSEFTWIDGIYNLILSGPPGVGKTHMAIALAYHACEQGYKASYTTMQSLMKYLRTEEIDRRSRTKMNRIRKSNLLVIDEVGYLPVSSAEGNLFFQLISELQEQASILLTTNKGFGDWTQIFGDPSLTAALLDRVTHRAHVINCSWQSYRLTETLKTRKKK